MIFLKFLGSFFHRIEQTVDESVSSDEDLKKSCRGSSIARASMKTSKKKLGEFFKSKNYDFKKQSKKLKKDDECDVLVSDRKRKPSKLSELLTPILSLRKNGASSSTGSLDKGFLCPKKPKSSPAAGGGGLLSSTSFVRQNPYWHDSLARCDVGSLSKQQLNRQEAIFELYRSEVDLVQDLKMICSTYRDSMLKLGLIDAREASVLFSDVHILVPVHEELIAGLDEARQPDGRTEHVGDVILEWIPRLVAYVVYCTNQIAAKERLDSKTRDDPTFRDFLDRCLCCPFSRKLDLWTFLDVPRSRLVKYPLLLKSILKHTPSDHPDHLSLVESLEAVEELIRDVDYNAGLARCRMVVSKLEYEDPKQMHPLIDASNFVLCDGMLRTRKGTKLHVFLLDKILVLTKPITKSGTASFRVYRRPVPLTDLGMADDPVPAGKPRLTEIHEAAVDGRVDRFGAAGRQGTKVCDLERRDSGFCSPGSSASFRNVLSSLSHNGRPNINRAASGTTINSNNNNHNNNNNNNSGDRYIELIVGDSFKHRYLLRADSELDRQHWLRCLRSCAVRRQPGQGAADCQGETRDPSMGSVVSGSNSSHSSFLSVFSGSSLELHGEGAGRAENRAARFESDGWLSNNDGSFSRARGA